MKHVLIVGGGFAGMRIARLLSNKNDIKLTIINPSPDFRYTPALYRVATGFRSAAAWLPIEWMLLDAKNATFVQGAVKKLNKEAKDVLLEDGRVISYDYVVFAIGNITSYFSIPGLDTYSYGVKSVEEVQRLKQHIHKNIIDPNRASRDYVIVGAGPTGVELAAVLGAHVKRVSKHHKVSSSHIKIHLIEAGPRTLPQLSERAGYYAEKQLLKNGVTLHVSMQVKAETVHTLKTSLGTIATDNVIWTAGTMNNPFFKNQPNIFLADKKGRIIVNQHLQVADYIYVCGDNAATPFSGLALTAINHANYVASDIIKSMSGKKRRAQRDKLPASVVPVGEHYAILQYGKIVLSGGPISAIRKAADIIGYTDVLGILKAFTIWRGSELPENLCSICGR
jgi:NADH dehydrogenase